MSRRYDSRTTIFSPEGRLYQVEYALEAINHAGTAIGILAKDGIALVAERKVTSKLLEQDCSAEKMYILNGTTLCAVAGMTADAAILVEYMRESSQEYLKIYNREPPVEHLVKKVCNFKQGYTQFGGLRPFGVSFLIAGYDERHEFQLYTSNPSGNYSGWRATSIGGNSSSAQTVLKQQLQEAAASNTDVTDATDASSALPTLEEAQKMALRVLGKTSDSTALTAERLEVATVALESNGRVQLRVWTPADVGRLLEESGVLEGEEAQE